MVIKTQTSIMLVFARLDILNAELRVSPVLNQAYYHPSTYNLYYVKGMLKGCYAILNAGLLGYRRANTYAGTPGRPTGAIPGY
jgi:hypothetical protein